MSFDNCPGLSTPKLRTPVTLLFSWWSTGWRATRRHLRITNRDVWQHEKIAVTIENRSESPSLTNIFQGCQRFLVINEKICFDERNTFLLVFDRKKRLYVGSRTEEWSMWQTKNVAGFHTIVFVMIDVFASKLVDVSDDSLPCYQLARDLLSLQRRSDRKRYIQLQRIVFYTEEDSIHGR